MRRFVILHTFLPLFPSSLLITDSPCMYLCCRRFLLQSTVSIQLIVYTNLSKERPVEKRAIEMREYLCLMSEPDLNRRWQLAASRTLAWKLLIVSSMLDSRAGLPRPRQVLRRELNSWDFSQAIYIYPLYSDCLDWMRPYLILNAKYPNSCTKHLLTITAPMQTALTEGCDK